MTWDEQLHSDYHRLRDEVAGLHEQLAAARRSEAEIRRDWATALDRLAAEYKRGFNDGVRAVHDDMSASIKASVR